MGGSALRQTSPCHIRPLPTPESETVAEWPVSRSVPQHRAHSRFQNRKAPRDLDQVATFSQFADPQVKPKARTGF